MDHDEMKQAAMEVADRMTAILDEVAVSATVQASLTIAEATALAVDNCEQEGHALSNIQQTHIQQAFLFVFRDYEELLRRQISAILSMSVAAADFTPEDIIGEEE